MGEEGEVEGVEEGLARWGKEGEEDEGGEEGGGYECCESFCQKKKNKKTNIL